MAFANDVAELAMSSQLFLYVRSTRLGVHFRQHRVLRGSFWLKLAFILIEIAMAIAFIVTSFRSSKNAAAVLVTQCKVMQTL